MVKVGHHSLELLLTQLSVCHAKTQFRQHLAEFSLCFFDGSHFIVQVIDLTTSQSFPENGLFHQGRVVLLNKRLDAQSSRRWCGNNG